MSRDKFTYVVILLQILLYYYYNIIVCPADIRNRIKLKYSTRASKICLIYPLNSSVQMNYTTEFSCDAWEYFRLKDVKVNLLN